MHSDDQSKHHSFRGMLCAKFGWDNINFAQGGSSNQKQFRLAKQFFSSDRFNRLQRSQIPCVVVWGITSTARNEIWSTGLGELTNIKYAQNSPESRWLATHTYDHEHEVTSLALEIQFWNRFFSQNRVPCVWFDTFNHHDYQTSDQTIIDFKKEYHSLSGPDWPSWNKFLHADFSNVPFRIIKEVYKFERLADYLRHRRRSGSVKEMQTHMLFGNQTPRDLLSRLAMQFGLKDLDQAYHTSSHKNDTNRISFLVRQGLINPFSYHPTRAAHELISEWFTHHIVTKFSNTEVDTKLEIC